MKVFVMVEFGCWKDGFLGQNAILLTPLWHHWSSNRHRFLSGGCAQIIMTLAKPPFEQAKQVHSLQALISLLILEQYCHRAFQAVDRQLFGPLDLLICNFSVLLPRNLEGASRMWNFYINWIG